MNNHDIKLARKLYSFLKPNDVLLGDRPFCAYADMVAITNLLNFLPKLETAHSQKRIRLYRSLLKIIVHKVVPNRPARSEPRVTKRCPKAYPRLTKPRQ
ncbi:MAG: hypothetical protein RMX96_33910 [Nostoc sp. ChiSLP02]|nr:hypothetical protein [Nostoc sp. DedSLP05]MDZ8097168.1 hypothetical protein [Nostoc sp. DedSLP01]MDZ8189817.1 hypothetical protein [Nostoc sp. ChiSLP02]